MVALRKFPFTRMTLDEFLCWDPDDPSGVPWQSIDGEPVAILKKRTLTNLYDERPTWLANAHRDLDAAVAAAYGWPADISEDDALARLFALNQTRAAAGG